VNADACPTRLYLKKSPSVPTAIGSNACGVAHPMVRRMMTGFARNENWILKNFNYGRISNGRQDKRKRPAGR
jgi:hypothetical protein